MTRNLPTVQSDRWWLVRSLRSGTKGIAGRARKNVVYIEGNWQRVPAAVLLALISLAINLCTERRRIRGVPEKKSNPWRDIPVESAWRFLRRVRRER